MDYIPETVYRVLKHYNKTAGIIEMLNKRRARALLLPKSDYAHGMPTGNDEADVYAPWIHDPWQTYLKHRAVANSMIVEALEKL